MHPPDSFQLARDLLAAFSATHGRPAALSHDGACIFTIAECVEIHFQVVSESEAVYFHCDVGGLKPLARAEQLLALLAANHHWAGGDGATLALDLDALTLERLVPLQELDADSLALLLSHTFESVKRLRREHADVLMDAPLAHGLLV